MSKNKAQTKRAPKRAAIPFHLLCKPTGPLCNLRCAHCFYLQKQVLYPKEIDWRMSEETLGLFVRRYIETQAASAPEVQFAWQGGEPTLLGIDFFRTALNFQKRYAAKGLTITNALQTNGTLLDDEWGKFLAENRFLVGISIDGPREQHDAYRKRADGQGSFDDVMKGLDVLRRHKVEYNTLTCVQANNAAHGKEVYSFLRDECGSAFMQFIPIVEFKEDGQASERSCRDEMLGTFLNAVFDAWVESDVGRVYVQHIEMLMSLLMGYPSPICTHAPVCGRALVVEHNGDVYACDHFVNAKDRRGNLHTDSLHWMVEHPDQKQFGLEKSSKLSPACGECPYLRFCYGGCPSDRDAAGLNVNCGGYRAFYEHALPVLQWMVTAIRAGHPACDWMQFATRER